MDTAVVCPVCSWFGVYRADVAGSISGCPNCGTRDLAVKDMRDDAIQQFGTQLLEELKASDPHAARRGTW